MKRDEDRAEDTRCDEGAESMRVRVGLQRKRVRKKDREKRVCESSCEKRERPGVKTKGSQPGEERKGSITMTPIHSGVQSTLSEPSGGCRAHMCIRYTVIKSICSCAYKFSKFMFIHISRPLIIFPNLINAC